MAVFVLVVVEVEWVAMGIPVIDGPIEVVGVFALPVDVLVGSPRTWVEFNVNNLSEHRLILMICEDTLGCMNLRPLSQYSHN